MRSSRPYVQLDPAVIEQARQMDLLSYLRAYEPNNLVRVGGSVYCTREHDSLKISNGKWFWWSRGIGGVSALDYLIKVKDYGFVEAVEALTGGAVEWTPPQTPKKDESKVLLLPPKNKDCNRVMQYLFGRGIDYQLIQECIADGTIYESADYHNAVFVGKDKSGMQKYAALRSTLGSPFKQDASGSDKRYSFRLLAKEPINTVHLFEAAIDLACAKNGDFDLIITKEISRFARNTLDSIYYTRELKKHGVGVIFMNDNINTLDGDAELRLAIMSSIAQEESRKTSERVKWGQKRQMEQGVVFGRSMLGYDVDGGKMTINEEGAKVVRLIFHKFVNEGKGTHVIARELREEGISPMRVKEWSNTVILRVIRNEKYCGDLVQKKTYTPDFLSHEKKYNRGQEEFVIIKDHHEPIISRELFDEANRILDAKSLSQEGKAKHSNRYPFSGKIKCGCCGSSYVARYKTRKDGSRYKAWRCNEAAKHGSPHIDKAGNQVGCTGLSIRNEDATHIMYLVTKSLKYNRNKIINNLTAVIQSIIAMDTTGTDVLKLQEQIKKIEGKRANLIDLYMSNLINKDEFTATRASCDAEIEELQSIIESVDKQREMIEQQQQLLKEIEDAIKEIVSGVEYEDEFYKHILDKMVVQDKDNIDVYLNLLPMKWSYTVAKASKKAVASEWNISEASLPMSVSRAFSSG